MIGPLIHLTQEELNDINNTTSTLKLGIIVAGFVDYLLKELVLFTATNKEICVPFNMFQERRNIKPDFHKFSLIDYGHTIKLGEYEAASSAILYELDPEYKMYADQNRLK